MKSPFIFRSSPRQGFTLVELLVVIAILAILAALIVPSVKNAKDSAQQAKSISNLRSIGNGLSLFLADNENRLPGRGNAGKERPLVRLAVYMNSQHGRTLDETAATGERFQRMEYGYRVPEFHYPSVPARVYTSGAPGFVSDVVGCYGLNIHLIQSKNLFWGRNILSIPAPSRTILAGERWAEDATSYYINSSGPYSTSNREGLASNESIRKNGVPSGSKANGTSGVLFADMHVEKIRLETLNPYPGKEGVNPKMTFELD